MSRTKRTKPYWADWESSLIEGDKLTRDGKVPKPISIAKDKSGCIEVWSPEEKKFAKKRHSKYKRKTKIDPRTIDNG